MCRPLVHVLLIHAFKTNYIIISITFYLFQLFTIYSAVSIIYNIKIVGRHPGIFTINAIILALVNALGYYLWEIVKSAYKQIKEENKNVQPAGNYQMNTYEKSPPAQYNHHVWICKVICFSDWNSLKNSWRIPLYSSFIITVWYINMLKRRWQSLGKTKEFFCFPVGKSRSPHLCFVALFLYIIILPKRKQIKQFSYLNIWKCSSILLLA